MLNLIPDPALPVNELGAGAAQPLATLTAEAVWLSNFTSDRTQVTYRDSIGRFIAHHRLADAGDLRSVTIAHVIAWRDAMKQKGESNRTIHTRLSALSSLFDHLCERQLADRNPVTGVKRPKVSQLRVQSVALTPKQVRRMLDAPDPRTLKGLRDSAFLHLLFFTGCRVAEPCALRVGDHFEDSGYSVIEFTVKGGKTNRLAIHQELQIALRRYLAAAGHQSIPTAPLLRQVHPTGSMRAITPRQALRIFRFYALKTGTPTNATPHSARATFITQALANECRLEAVQESVAHANIQTTRMYDKRTLLHRESASFAVQF